MGRANIQSVDVDRTQLVIDSIAKYDKCTKQMTKQKLCQKLCANNQKLPERYSKQYIFFTSEIILHSRQQKTYQGTIGK